MNVNSYLEKLDKFTENPNLEAMTWLMKSFGNPHEKMKFIHVAGTNGKGSICEMLSSILCNTKYNIGKFISPHLIKFNDGISINNKNITDEEVEEILIPLSEKVKEYNETHKVPVKWFEVITCVALIYFSNKKCDIAVIETGLGGLTDCTNIINSMISIIANIGYDHIDVLGNTIEQITKHKAGIIKQNTDTVAVYQKDVTEIIKETCINKNAKLHLVQDDDIKNYSYDNEFQKFDYKSYKNILINLKGKVQVNNSCEVLECIDILKKKGISIPKIAIENGLKTVVHRARMETLSKKPLIIFDGGHNENAINNLKSNLEQYYSDYKNKIYIISILKTKDYRTIIRKICEDKDGIFFFTNGNDSVKYVSNEDLYKEAEKYTCKNKLYKKELKDALISAKREYKNDLILVIGSFYVYKDVVEK